MRVRFQAAGQGARRRAGFKTFRRGVERAPPTPDPGGERPTTGGDIMASGGRRIRSGPNPDPNSRTSERRGYTLQDLPNTEYRGRAPQYPLPEHRVRKWDNDANRWVTLDEDTERFRERELELWRWLWRQPQARAWRLPQYGYMRMELAQWARMSVICESPDAKAADRSILLRLADRIGLTPAGLAALGWRIADETVDRYAAAEVPMSDAEAARTGRDTKIVHFPRRLREA